MAKSIMEELEALVGKDAAAKIAAKSDIATRLQEGERLYRFYTGDDDDPDAAAEAERARLAQEATDRQKMADKAEADRQALARTSTTTPDSKSIISELTILLDTRLNALESKFVPAAKLNDYKTELLTSAIKTSHEISRIESTHEKEFNEPLDMDKLDAYVTEQRKAGTNWPSITAAYSNWVSERRIEARVAKEVAEQLKQKTSSTAVPAQTHTASLSPAQQILRDARKGPDGEGTKTNAMKAAEKLAALERARESGEAA